MGQGCSDAPLSFFYEIFRRIPRIFLGYLKKQPQLCAVIIKTSYIMARSKYICVRKHHNGRTTLWCGTLQSLIRDVFDYTLKAGHSRRSSIDVNPKGLKSLVLSLNKSYEVCRRLSAWAQEGSYEEFIAAGGVIKEGEENGYVILVD